jgi:CBS domain-containing protein
MTTPPSSDDDVTVGGFDRRPWSSIPVEQVMRRHVLTCHTDATMRELALIMVTHSVHAVVVVDDDGDSDGEPSVAGIVTALELALAAVEGATPTAGELANPHAPTVTVGSTLEEAARAILRTGGAHVIVTDERGAPMGMLSTLDLARVTAWGHA